MRLDRNDALTIGCVAVGLLLVLIGAYLITPPAVIAVTGGCLLWLAGRIG